MISVAFIGLMTGILLVLTCEAIRDREGGLAAVFGGAGCWGVAALVEAMLATGWFS